MKAAVYIRVSTLDQHPENQRLALKEYVEKEGWDYEVFEEKMSTRKKRPIKNEVYQKCMHKEFDILVIWKIGRWGRSTREVVNDFENLHNKGIKIVSLQDNIDMTTPNGRFFMQVLAAFAELEREIIRERVKAGLKRAKSEGKKLGRPKGSKDKKIRRKSGYHQRYAKKHPHTK